MPLLILFTFRHMLRQPPPPHWRKFIERSMKAAPASKAGCIITLIAVLTVGTLALAAGTVWAVLMANRTSTVIGRIRAAGEYAVLATTPAGAIGTNVNILRGLLHYAITVEDFIRQQWLATLAIMLFLILNYTPATPLETIVAWLLLVLAVHLDQEYGLIAGGMIGILLDNDVRPLSGLIAGGLHALGYGVGMLCLLVIPGVLSSLAGPPVVFGVFLLWREVTTRLLWGVVLKMQDD